jgi:hypothetical protein
MAGAKLTSLSYLGLAVETTLGTPVAATGFIPVRSFKPQDNPKYVQDTGYRGQPVDLFGEYLGIISSQYDIEGDAYPGSFGNILAMIFGQDTLSGSSAPYTHKFVPIATPPSYTLGDYYVAGYRQWPGCKASKLSIKFTPDAGLTYTTTLLGFPSATATEPTTQTFGVNPYFLGWEASLSIGGTQNTKLNSFSLNLQRKGSKAIFSAANSQNPFDIFVGPLSADWDLDFYMEDDSEYELALSQATKAVSITLTQPGTSYALTFTSSAVQFTKPTIDRSKEFVQVKLTGSAIFNATDASVITSTLINGTTAAYTTTAAS